MRCNMQTHAITQMQMTHMQTLSGTDTDTGTDADADADKDADTQTQDTLQYIVIFCS